MSKKKESHAAAVSGTFKIPMAARLSGNVSLEDLLKHTAKLQLRSDLRKSLKGAMGGPQAPGNPIALAVQTVMVNKLVNGAMRQLTGKNKGKSKDQSEPQDAATDTNA